jgi:hypothetical protein
MDTIAQFAELCVRREPDTARDPLDAAEPVVFARAEVRGRTKINDDAPLTTARAADPAHRRICQKLAMQSAECRADNRGRSSLWKAFRGR